MATHYSEKNCHGTVVSRNEISLDDCRVERGPEGTYFYKYAVKLGKGPHVKAISKLAVVYDDDLCTRLSFSPIQAGGGGNFHTLAHYPHGCDVKTSTMYEHAVSPSSSS